MGLFVGKDQGYRPLHACVLLLRCYNHRFSFGEDVTMHDYGMQQEAVSKIDDLFKHSSS